MGLYHQFIQFLLFQFIYATTIITVLSIDSIISYVNMSLSDSIVF